MTVTTAHAPTANAAAPQSSPTTPVDSTQVTTALTPTSDAAVVPQTVTKPEGTDTDLSKQFAALSRKERTLLEREKKAAELEKKYGKFGNMKPKENPLAWLETGEISIEELIQAKLKEGKPPTAEERALTVEEKLAKLEQKLEEERAASKQEHTNREVQKVKNHIRTLIDTDKVKYELIATHGAHDEVYAVCEQYYNENWNKPDFKPLDYLKAADLVEDHLFNEAKKFATVSKYKNLFVPPEVPKDTKQATDTPKPEAEPTLTNRGTTPSAPASKTLPREQAIAAIAAQWDRRG